MTTQNIQNAIDKWVETFSLDSPNSICSLYHQEATLWGTLSPIKRDTPKLIQEYFHSAFQYTDRKVIFKEFTIRIYKDIGVCSGFYDFSWKDNEALVNTKARFSLVYKYEKGKCLIIEHHSSVLP